MRRLRRGLLTLICRKGIIPCLLRGVHFLLGFLHSCLEIRHVLRVLIRLLNGIIVVLLRILIEPRLLAVRIACRDRRLIVLPRRGVRINAVLLLLQRELLLIELQLILRLGHVNREQHIPGLHLIADLDIDLIHHIAGGIPAVGGMRILHLPVIARDRPRRAQNLLHIHHLRSRGHRLIPGILHLRMNPVADPPARINIQRIRRAGHACRSNHYPERNLELPVTLFLLNFLFRGI